MQGWIYLLCSCQSFNYFWAIWRNVCVHIIRSSSQTSRTLFWIWCSLLHSRFPALSTSSRMCVFSRLAAQICPGVSDLRHLKSTPKRIRRLERAAAVRRSRRAWVRAESSESRISTGFRASGVFATPQKRWYYWTSTWCIWTWPSSLRDHSPWCVLRALSKAPSNEFCPESRDPWWCQCGAKSRRIARRRTCLAAIDKIAYWSLLHPSFGTVPVLPWPASWWGTYFGAVVRSISFPCRGSAAFSSGLGGASSGRSSWCRRKADPCSTRRLSWWGTWST